MREVNIADSIEVNSQPTFSVEGMLRIFEDSFIRHFTKLLNTEIPSYTENKEEDNTTSVTNK